MFTKKSFVDEIAQSMENHLVDGVINKQAELQNKLFKAADYLNAAAEIFDEEGMTAQAEITTVVLESLAAKKKDRNKAKDKKNKKKPAKKKALTSEKMVSNLKEKGWVFDENSANDGKIGRFEDVQHLVSRDARDLFDFGITAFSSDPAELMQIARKYKSEFAKWSLDRLETAWNELKDVGAVNKSVGSFLDLEESSDNDTNHAEDQSCVDDNCAMCGDMSYVSDNNDELYSMLEDFKSNSGNVDFEDEDDDFEVTVQDPFRNSSKTYVDEDVTVQDPFAGFDKIRL